jgi:ferritin-like metal-binding protein YciE
MTSINSLKDLLIDEMKDLYSAEQQLVKALPKMADAATNSELKEGFTSHLEQTRGHVQRLEEAFGKLGVSAKPKTCKAMQGLIAEGAEAIELDSNDPIRDACLIGAAQRVEHYEIAAYGTARAFAATIGEDEVADLLQETLDEEAETDKKLTAMSSGVNDEANTSSGADDEESEKPQGKGRSR